MGWPMRVADTRCAHPVSIDVKIAIIATTTNVVRPFTENSLGDDVDNERHQRQRPNRYQLRIQCFLRRRIHVLTLRNRLRVFAGILHTECTDGAI